MPDTDLGTITDTGYLVSKRRTKSSAFRVRSTPRKLLKLRHFGVCKTTSRPMRRTMKADVKQSLAAMRQKLSSGASASKPHLRARSSFLPPDCCRFARRIRDCTYIPPYEQDAYIIRVLFVPFRVIAEDRRERFAATEKAGLDSIAAENSKSRCFQPRHFRIVGESASTLVEIAATIDEHFLLWKRPDQVTAVTVGVVHGTGNRVTSHVVHCPNWKVTGNNFLDARASGEVPHHSYYHARH